VQYSEKELLEEIARRHADTHYREGKTMSEMELPVEAMRGHRAADRAPALADEAGREGVPRCGKRTPLRARDRERAVKSLAGLVTFPRNDRSCEECQYGFYPVDRLLMLPEEGDLTSEPERRVPDFAVNDVYGDCTARRDLHKG